MDKDNIKKEKIMLEKSDLILLENMMRNVVVENNSILRAEFKQDMSDMKAELRAEFKQDMSDMRAEFKQEISGLRRDLEGTIKEEIEKSETLLLDEIERYYLMANEDIQELKGKVERIDQYYSLRRLEDDERNLRLDQLQMEVDSIKERLAI